MIPPKQQGETRRQWRERRRLELAKRRSLVAELYVKGRNYSDISKELGCSVTTVCEDVQAQLSEWGRTAGVHISAHIAREFEKINHLEAEAWRAYDKSEGVRRSVSARKVMVPLKDDNGAQVIDGNGQPIMIESSISSATEVQPSHGDMRCLQMVDRCIARRMQLFSLVKAGLQETEGKKDQPTSWVELIAREIAEREAKMINVTPRPPQLPAPKTP